MSVIITGYLKKKVDIIWDISGVSKIIRPILVNLFILLFNGISTFLGI